MTIAFENIESIKAVALAHQLLERLENLDKQCFLYWLNKGIKVYQRSGYVFVSAYNCSCLFYATDAFYGGVTFYAIDRKNCTDFPPNESLSWKFDIFSDPKIESFKDLEKKVNMIEISKQTQKPERRLRIVKG